MRPVEAIVTGRGVRARRARRARRAGRAQEAERGLGNAQVITSSAQHNLELATLTTRTRIYTGQAAIITPIISARRFELAKMNKLLTNGSN